MKLTAKTFLSTLYELQDEHMGRVLILIMCSAYVQSSGSAVGDSARTQLSAPHNLILHCCW